MSDFREIATTLREARLMAGARQWKFAREIGTQQPYFSGWERGVRAPSFERIQRWAAALGYELRLVKKETR